MVYLINQLLKQLRDYYEDLECENKIKNDYLKLMLNLLNYLCCKRARNYQEINVDKSIQNTCAS